MGRNRKKHKSDNKPNPKRNVSPPNESRLIQQETGSNNIRTTSEQQKQNELPIRNDDQAIKANSIATKQLVVNVVVAIITLGLFTYTVIQTSLTRKSVDAAIKSVELSRKQFEVQNQPLIVTKPEGCKINFLPDGQVVITYMVVNIGNYPTKIIKDRPVLIICDSGKPESILLDMFESELKKSDEYDKDILIPNTPTILVSKSTFRDTQEEQLIREGKRTVVYGGELTYQDRLSNKKYRLKFAFSLMVVNWPNELIGDGIYYTTTEIK